MNELQRLHQYCLKADFKNDNKNGEPMFGTFERPEGIIELCFVNLTRHFHNISVWESFSL